MLGLYFTSFSRHWALVFEVCCNKYLDSDETGLVGWSVRGQARAGARACGFVGYG